MSHHDPESEKTVVFLLMNLDGSPVLRITALIHLRAA
jgi:hypothetical protein